MSGLDAAGQLTADTDTRQIPVIAASAFAMAGAERRALDHGRYADVAKPTILKDVLNLITGHLGVPEGA